MKKRPDNRYNTVSQKSCITAADSRSIKPLKAGKSVFAFILSALTGMFLLAIQPSFAQDENTKIDIKSYIGKTTDVMEADLKKIHMQEYGGGVLTLSIWGGDVNTRIGSMAEAMFAIVKNRKATRHIQVYEKLIGYVPNKTYLGGMSSIFEIVDIKEFFLKENEKRLGFEYGCNSSLLPEGEYVGLYAIGVLDKKREKPSLASNPLYAPWTISSAWHLDPRTKKIREIDPTTVHCKYEDSQY